MRGHLLLTEAQALAEDDAEDERAPARGHVDDGASGEVDRLDGGIGIPDAVHLPRDAPDHVRHGEIDDEHPEADEGHNGREFHALGDGADDEGRGDDGEHELIHREDVLADPVGVVGVRRGGDALEEEVFAAAEEGAAVVLAEDEAVADGPPEDGD